MPAKITVLVVDDIEENRLSFQDRLESLEVSVVLADDGFMGLEVLSQRTVDVILLDHNMPGMTGFEFLDHLTQDQNLSAIPVIMMSSILRLNEIAVAQKGAAAWVYKNATPQELQQCLHQLGIIQDS